MWRRVRNLLWSIPLLVAASLLPAGIALTRDADDVAVIDSAVEVHGHVHSQHGGGGGHLPAGSANVRLVGKMRVNQDVEGRVGDVGVLGDYAYLAAFDERDCQKGGVYVFDIADPAAPKQINFIRAANNSYVGEGVQVIRVATAAFTGDLLIHNNEICGTAKTGAKGGISLVDVTNPKVHKYLAEGVGDVAPAGLNGPGVAHTVHSAFAWQAGARLYAVLVDNEEGPDVDILDITNPRSPVLIAEYALNVKFPQIIQPEFGTGASFFHDVIVKKIGERYVMLISYWDGGYVTLDVTDPRNAAYIGDSDFALPDAQALRSGLRVRPEGNAHEAEFSRDNRYIVAADEDFAPFSIAGRNTTDATEFQVLPVRGTPPLDGTRTVTGQTVFVGLACTAGGPLPAAGAGTVAVAERGVCPLAEKIANVHAAGGYTGVIIFSWESNTVLPDGTLVSPESTCTTVIDLLGITGSIPALFVGRHTALSFFDVPYDAAACLDSTPQLAPMAIGTRGDRVDVRRVFDGWGYVHLFRNGPGKLAELDTYAIPQAHNPAYAAGYGTLSAHEVAMSERRDDLAYLAYYAGGLRVLKIVNNRLMEVGHFIDQGGNNFWGVQVWQKDGKEYVLASDRDYGLYIFEYVGAP